MDSPSASPNPSPSFAEAILRMELPRMTPMPSPDRILALDGLWEFDPAPGGKWSGAPFPSPASITVPGEWVQQGFSVAPGCAAGYRRVFSVPGAWAGMRVKLRLEAVYSQAVVHVNGRVVGSHMGGFTPHEIDVTEAVQFGADNVLGVLVTSEGPADRSSFASAYAAHPLGGITGAVRLFAVPGLHVAALRIQTIFDAEYQDATLHLDLEVAGRQEPAGGAGPELVVELADAQASPLLLHRGRVAGLPTTGGFASLSLDLPIHRPRKWDCEHPNLYTLRLHLDVPGGRRETVEQRIGFRQVDVSGNRLLVNGRPVKLAGACHHNVHPLAGRAADPERDWQDVRLFREANMNYLRTSHYPPSPDFLEACDELGMLVEVEAPFCWVPQEGIPDCEPAALLGGQTLEMVARDYNHPSVIVWSLANESKRWEEYFRPIAQRLRDLRTGRPIVFNHGLPDTDGGFCDIGSHHYPGPTGPATYAGSARPVVYDEYCHLNAYNREELAADPGLRDLWGGPFGAMWEAMRESAGTLGGALWAAIDDTFLLPSGKFVGYGAWGVIDGWRRPKPEYFHVRKAYCPVRLGNPGIRAGSVQVRVPVENRHAFTDLRELAFRWTLGSQGGAATAVGGPGETGCLELDLALPAAAGDTLWIEVESPRGFVMDACTWAVPAPDHQDTETDPVASPLELVEAESAVTVSSPGFHVTFDRGSGRLLSAEVGGRKVLSGGPTLMILPLINNAGSSPQIGEGADAVLPTPACGDWHCQGVTVARRGVDVSLEAAGNYADATGVASCTVSPGGRLRFDYRFTTAREINPRQVGLVFDLPRECDTLAWRRRTGLSGYPDDHIGRPVGEARAVSGTGVNGALGPRTTPSWSWSQDDTALGSNDFRSTKAGVISAELRDSAGGGVRLLSDGSQSIRAWLEEESVRFLVANYSNGGFEQYFRPHIEKEFRLLPAGAEVAGGATLELLRPATNGAR